jgi:hypothetical protein
LSNSETPLLVVHGGDPARLDRVRRFALFGTVALLMGTFALAVKGGVPTLAFLQGWRPPKRLSDALVGILLAIAAVVAIAAQRFARRRLGRVEFFAEEVVFFVPATASLTDSIALGALKVTERRVRVPWGEIASFEDASSDFVVVKRKAGDLTVPTLREEDRVAVLDLLVKRGVPRTEST